MIIHLLIIKGCEQIQQVFWDGRSIFLTALETNKNKILGTTDLEILFVPASAHPFYILLSTTTVHVFVYPNLRQFSSTVKHLHPQRIQSNDS